ARDKSDELEGTSGALINILSQLFTDVREESENYREAQMYLERLAHEMDPGNVDSEYGRMMSELNEIMSSVFPNTQIRVETALSDADRVIKPQFSVTMSSNVETPVRLQGTGMIRSAVFALLRYRSLRDSRIRAEGNERDRPLQPLLIGFEEPETYLHPNAANLMRDTIYELASGGSSQIVCTTHSPYMIDLTRKPSQTLNGFAAGSVAPGDADLEGRTDTTRVCPFTTTRAFRSLCDEDKSYVKMLLKIDDHMARVFFAKNVLVVEGDTEDIVLKETIARMPPTVRSDVLASWQIAKACGKATIISLVRYLSSMSIYPVVIHDEDGDTEGAAAFNAPILQAVGDESRRVMLHNCIEDVLGYRVPSRDKPLAAYRHISDTWGSAWGEMPVAWRTVVEKVFASSFALIYATATPVDEAAATIDQ
ncbi:MAG TPA: hypothetical protein DDZ84_02915, partial [Firmicutes bacterium]|nr:hypothetical protein [Bacillota bacterium]